MGVALVIVVVGILAPVVKVLAPLGVVGVVVVGVGVLELDNCVGARSAELL